MAFVSARCPNCGATIQIDNMQQTGFCQYCGSKILVQEVISKVKIDTSKSFANYKELAATALRSKDEEALKKYSELALEINPRDSHIWYYKGVSADWSSQWSTPNTEIIIECGKNAIKYAADDDKGIAQELVHEMYLDAALNKVKSLEGTHLGTITSLEGTSFDDMFSDTYLKIENAIIELVNTIPADCFDDHDKWKDKRNSFAKFWCDLARDNYLGEERMQKIRDVFFKVSPLSLSEKEKVWNLLETDSKTRLKKLSLSLSSENKFDGCLTTTFVFVVILAIILYIILLF